MEEFIRDFVGGWSSIPREFYNKFWQCTQAEKLGCIPHFVGFLRGSIKANSLLDFVELLDEEHQLQL